MTATATKYSTSDAEGKTISEVSKLVNVFHLTTIFNMGTKMSGRITQFYVENTVPHF